MLHEHEAYLLCEYITSGQPILVKNYILHVERKPFLYALTNGNKLTAIGFEQKYLSLTWWMSHAQLAYI